MTTQVLSTDSHDEDTVVRRAVFAAMGATFALALAAGLTEVLRAVPVWVIPLYVVGFNAALVMAYRRSEAFRRWVLALSWQALALPHALRAGFGAGFLVMMARGVMPPSIALHAGIGDILAGLGVVVLALAPMSRSAKLRALLVWNVFGLVDIVTVVVGFQRVLLVEGAPRLAEVFPRLPFPMLPFFVVPLVIASHLALFGVISSRR